MAPLLDPTVAASSPGSPRSSQCCCTESRCRLAPPTPPIFSLIAYLGRPLHRLANPTFADYTISAQSPPSPKSSIARLNCYCVFGRCFRSLFLRCSSAVLVDFYTAEPDPMRYFCQSRAPCPSASHFSSGPGPGRTWGSGGAFRLDGNKPLAGTDGCKS